MGELEVFQRKINGTLSEEEIKVRLEELKRDIRQDWESYKRYHSIMHDNTIKDNGLSMVLVYLIKKGVL